MADMLKHGSGGDDERATLVPVQELPMPLRRCPGLVNIVGLDETVVSSLNNPIPVPCLRFPRWPGNAFGKVLGDRNVGVEGNGATGPCGFEGLKECPGSVFKR